MVYDSIIVGTGVASLEASIILKIRNKNFLIIGPKELSTKIDKSPIIDNYLGLPHIRGNDLKENFRKHIDDLGITITDEIVKTIYASDTFSVMTNKNTYEAKSIILGVGLPMNKSFNNEDKFVGMGISYCATCDAMFYKNKNVAVIGYNEESIEEANFLSEVVNKVYFIPYTTSYEGLNSNIEVINKKVVSFEGKMKLDKIILEDQELSVDGAFVIRDFVACDSLIPGIAMDKNHILVDSNQKTNLEGVYACGDVTGKPYQYMKACGEGLKAAFSVIEYLNKKDA